MHGNDWHLCTVNNLKTLVQGGSYVQLKSVKNMLFTVTVLGYQHWWGSWSSIVGADMAMAGRLFQRREKGSLVGVDGTILYQESLLMTFSWYTSGYWSAGISTRLLSDIPVHHCNFVLALIEGPPNQVLAALKWHCWFGGNHCSRT